jgi:hypothetical protein
VRADVAQRVGDVAGLGEHLEPVLALEQQPQAAAHDDVVVGEDDRDALRVAVGGHAATLPARSVESRRTTD